MLGRCGSLCFSRNGSARKLPIPGNLDLANATRPLRSLLSRWQAPPTHSKLQGFSEYLVCVYAFYFIWHVDSPWATGHLLIPQASVQRLRQMPRSTSPSNASVQRLCQIPPSSTPNVPGTKYSCPSHCRSVSSSDTSVTPRICSATLVAPLSLSIQHPSCLCLVTEGSRSLPR